MVVQGEPKRFQCSATFSKDQTHGFWGRVSVCLCLLAPGLTTPDGRTTCLSVKFSQILSSISKRMADMHEAGYVHRDLKPSNIIWLPRQNRWTVIDFGCIARVGEAAPMCFTLTYAAPEVVRAYIDGKRRHPATAAVDAWSLGVMAFELLTGTPAFDLVSSGRQKVRTSCMNIYCSSLPRTRVLLMAV